MANHYSGDILSSLREPISETFDFGKESLGTCWVNRINGSQIKDVARRGRFEAGHREIFIPSENGELISRLVEMVGNAQDMVCLSSFLIQKSPVTDALLAAEKRGVKVFILTAREEDLKNLDDERLEGEKEIINSHIELLNAFAEKILVRTSDSFHAKYILVDPHLSNARGMMMTCNATVDPMNGSNIEIALSLGKEEIRSFFSHFLHGFWEMGNHELLSPGKLSAVKKDLPFKPDLGTVTLPATFGTTNTLREQVVDLIQNAQTSITITAWSFDADCAIVKALEDACARGVSVTIGTKPNTRNTKALLNLAERNASIYGHPRFHAKCILVDGERGLITTSNFTKLGLESGFETSVPLNGEEVRLADSLVASCLENCYWYLKHNLLTEDADGNIRQFTGEKNDLVDWMITPYEEENLPDFNLQSLEQISSYTIQRAQAEKIVKNLKGRKVKTLGVSQRIIAPTLPNNAEKEEQKDIPFGVYRIGKGKKFVVVRTWEDMQSAREYAKKINAKIVVNQ